MATSVVKLDVPVIVKAPVSVIVPPEVTLKSAVDKLLSKLTPPVPVSRVRLLNEEAVVERLTALAPELATNVSGKEVKDTPSTVIVPLFALPIVRLPAVIWPSSVFVKE